MAYYPLLFQLSGCRCLVVGAGRVGARKIAALLERDPAEVLVLDPQPPSPQMQAFLDHPAMRYECRPFTEADLEGRALVFAATSAPTVNLHVARACRERGILCNVADAPDAGNFSVPATLERHGVCLSLSTGGKSPALSRILKDELAKWLDTTLVNPLLLDFMGRLRALILAAPLQGDSDAHAEIFRAMGQQEFRLALGQALSNGNTALCRALVEEKLPQNRREALRSELDSILTGLCQPAKETGHDLP